MHDNALGVKNWNCDISATSFIADSDLWHEMLHSSSASYYDPKVYANNQIIEESTVELLCWEICKEKKIPIDIGYRDYVIPLRTLVDYVREIPRIDFVKEFYNVPLPDRFRWFRLKYEEKLKSDNYSEDEIFDALNEYDRFDGAFE